MKAIKFLAVLLLCFVLQEVSAQFELGIKTGYTRAWEDYGDVTLPDNAVIHVNKFHINTQAYFHVKDYLKVGMEPGYAQRGAACVPGWNWDPNPIFEGDTKFYLNYVEVPLMVSGNLGFFQNKLEVFAKAGYGASFLTSAFQEQEVVIGEDPPIKSRTRIPLNGFSNLNRWDHGFHTGLGAGFNFGAHQIFVESSLYNGMADAEKFNTSKNRSLQFSLGYTFKIL